MSITPLNPAPQPQTWSESVLAIRRGSDNELREVLGWDILVTFEDLGSAWRVTVVPRQVNVSFIDPEDQGTAFAPNAADSFTKDDYPDQASIIAAGTVLAAAKADVLPLRSGFDSDPIYTGPVAG